MADSVLKGFFAYPSSPRALAETIRTASERIRHPSFQSQVWEDLRIGGKVIISEILNRIEECDLFMADVTGINANVMFELGFAVASKKRVWLVLDPSRTNSKRDYDQFRLLTGVGYCQYVNSQEIVNAFFRDHPFHELDKTIFAAHIEPILSIPNRSGVLCLKSRYETDADRKISEAVARNMREGLPCIVDDPNETSVQPLAWYAQNVYAASAVLAHLCGESRDDARIHNAREAFVCGLAVGFGKPVLMLAEQDYAPPLDYKDLLINYSTAREAVAHAEVFLSKVVASYRAQPVARAERSRAIELATELRGLRIGEYIAEQEADSLGDYFVDTAAYRAVVEGQHAIFVGRKGTGKTANLLRAAAELRSDKRNLVVVIQPVGYDLSGLTRLLRTYRERDAKGYLVDSLWKFLIYSEIGQAAASSLEQRPSLNYSPAERQLLNLFRNSTSPLTGDFAVRLERALESLSPVDASSGIETTRLAISESLHSGLLSDLRRLLGEILTDRERVAVLIDNLDKAWVRNEDLEHLSELILGLLSAAGRMPTDFSKGDRYRKPVNLTLAVFLRSDIFQFIARAAREPDKLSFSKISWEDPELLMRVLDERLATSQPHPESIEDIWRRFFVPNIGTIPIREYIVSRTLPRPRDILYFARAAVATAINRRHVQVSASDIHEAEKQYSQYALDTVETEATAAFPDLGNLLYEFVGATEILERDSLDLFLRKAGFDDKRSKEAIEFLLSFGFLGLEVREAEFGFANDENQLKKNSVLSRKLRESSGRAPRYSIHPSFHSYLEIQKGAGQPNLFGRQSTS